jgi:hypothetical protein
MKIIDTKGAILTGDNHPSLKIGDKVYVVDDRKSTWDKIQAMQSDPNTKDVDTAALELALGKKALKEIMEADGGITLEGFQNLTFYVMAAITGQDYDTLKKEATRKN